MWHFGKGDPNRLRQGPLINITRDQERPPSRYLDRFRDIMILYLIRSIKFYI